MTRYVKSQNLEDQPNIPAIQNTLKSIVCHKKNRERILFTIFRTGADQYNTAGSKNIFKIRG